MIACSTINVKSLFPYYGGKFNQLRDILGIMGEHLGSFDVVVDVFGGSGKVLLNIPQEWEKMKVYNDINEELYITFKVLQDPRKRVQLSRKLRLAFSHSGIFRDMRRRHFRSDVDTAFKVLYLQTYSYMGDGSTYGRYYKGHKVKRFSIENFIYVRDWMIENMDFRDLMDRYKRERVFFYLDPPYISSGKKYRYSFSINDMKDLKYKMEAHKGSHILNLSSFDEGREEIFGEPNRMMDYSNPLNNHGKVRWGCGYWWRFG